MRPRLLLVACMLGGCGEGHDRLGREGDPCRSVAEVCADHENLLVCADEVWTARSCEELCAGEAPGVSSGGCEAASVVEGRCVCEPPSGGCTPGEAVCVDAQQIEVCDGSWTWAVVGCESVCAADPIYAISLGCEADDGTGAASCSCTAIATACTDEAPVCLDHETLARCESGAWARVECADSCGGAASCRAAIGGADCDCE